jgi:hypothetical protein
MIRWLRNPPVDRWFISLFIGFQHVSTILLVVQDFAISISSGIGGTVSVIFSHHFFLELAQEADPFLGEHRNGVGDLKRVSYVTICL